MATIIFYPREGRVQVFGYIFRHFNHVDIVSLLLTVNKLLTRCILAAISLSPRGEIVEYCRKKYIALGAITLRASFAFMCN